MSDDEVYKRLNNLDTGFARVEENVKEVRKDIQHMNQKLDRYIEQQNKILHGNGGPGALTRIDRLEQREDTRANHIKGIWAGFCVLVGKFVYDWLTK